MLRQLYSPSTHFCHKYDCTYSTVRLYRSFWIQEAWDPAMDSSHRPRSAARSSAAEISSRPGSSACQNQENGWTDCTSMGLEQPPRTKR
jgi:hypothetical protein